MTIPETIEEFIDMLKKGKCPGCSEKRKLHQVVDYDGPMPTMFLCWSCKQLIVSERYVKPMEHSNKETELKIKECQAQIEKLKLQSEIEILQNRVQQLENQRDEIVDMAGIILDDNNIKFIYSDDLKGPSADYNAYCFTQPLDHDHYKKKDD